MMFAIGSLIVVTLVGMLWDRLARDLGESEDPDAVQVIGIRRIGASFVYMCRELCGAAGAWTLVAALGMFLLAVFLPHGALQHSVGPDDWSAPARMLTVSIPVYATPMVAMSQLGMMFQHANSPGAAFNLLVLGAGLNLATVIWMARTYGVRSVATWFVGLGVVVLLISYSINRPLVPPGVEPADHTHAFDVYTNPLHGSESISKQFISETVEERFGLIEQITVSIVGIVLVAGLLFRLLGVSEHTFRKPGHDSLDVGSVDRIVAPQTVGATMIVGVIALSIAMCYSFYPSADECLEELKFIRADALSAAIAGNYDHAVFWIPRWDDWLRRTEVGVALRTGGTTPYQRMQGYLMRKKLETLEHELMHDDHDRDVIDAIVKDLTMANARWVKAFRPKKDG